MNAILVTFRRTVARSCRQLSTALALAAFLSVAAILFVLGIERAEGSHLTLAAVWATAVAPVLPALAALLSMDVWSGERQSGRMDLLLSVAVRERDYVLGKFAGVAFLVFVALALSLVSVQVALPFFSSEAAFSPLPCAYALFALTLQGACWCAAGVAVSAACRSTAASLGASFLLLAVLPRLAWQGFRFWLGRGQTAFGDLPLDEHVVDFASGIFPLGTVAAYLFVTLLLLFMAGKLVAFGRFLGRGALGLRASTVFALLLSLLAMALAVRLSLRVNPTVELSTAGIASSLAGRTRDALRVASGDMTLTLFLSRGNVRFREVSRLLRLLRRESEFLGGVRIDLKYVDPHWDIGAAERLVRDGVSENTVVFEKGGRRASVPVDRDFGERIAAATIGRLTQPLQRRNVCWTTGHGECDFDAYTAFGMSDIARDLVREGFVNVRLDLATSPRIPADCALVLVAGAKDDFSRAEIGRLEEYLRAGGRLLVMLASAKPGSVNSLLASWGLRPADLPQQPVRTMTGSDVVVSTFAEHPVAKPLCNSRIVMERPVAFTPSAVTGVDAGVGRIVFSPIALAGSAAVVAATERGTGLGSDLALRPTRVIALGDASFAMNGPLAARASANRDFFLNCVSYLSGSDPYGSGEASASVFRLGLDRRAKAHLVAATALAVPLAVFLALFAASVRRGRWT